MLRPEDATDSTSPTLRIQKPIRDSQHTAEKDGQSFSWTEKPIRDSRLTAEKDGQSTSFPTAKPIRDSSRGAEKDGQSLTGRKPNRDSPFRGRSAEKVGRRRGAESRQ